MNSLFNGVIMPNGFVSVFIALGFYFDVVHGLVS